MTNYVECGDFQKNKTSKKIFFDPTVLDTNICFQDEYFEST